jgi:hypothetical protein
MINNVNDFFWFNPHETEAAESFEGRQEPIPKTYIKQRPMLNRLLRHGASKTN